VNIVNSTPCLSK